jgi:hypothetical protein
MTTLSESSESSENLYTHIFSLENSTKDVIVDDSGIGNTSNVVLPNLRQIGPSKSRFLSTQHFSKYLDVIIDSLSSSSVCSNNSYYIDDYFVEIDFAELFYKIPSKLMDNLVNCKEKNINLYVIPIGLNFEFNKPGHANIIIIDNETKLVEFFEPHGIMILIFI